MAKGTDETTKKYWQEMLVDMQIKIKGQNIALENNDIQALNAKTNIAIGTLNGYFGLDKSKMPANYPNADTRNLLAKEILGFVDWNEYVKSKKIETVETENPKITIMNPFDDFEQWKIELLALIGKDEIRIVIDKIMKESEVWSEANKTAIILSGQFTPFEKNITLLGIDVVKQDTAYKKFVGLQLTPFVANLKEDDLKK